MERERFFPLPPFFLHISFAPFSLFSNLGKLLRLIESVYSISIFFLFDFSKILFFFLQEESRDWSLNFLKPSSVYLPGISPRFVAPADSAKYAALRSRPPETSVEFHPFWATARLAREILFPATNPPARP